MGISHAADFVTAVFVWPLRKGSAILPRKRGGLRQSRACALCPNLKTAQHIVRGRFRRGELVAPRWGGAPGRVPGEAHPWRG